MNKAKRNLENSIFTLISKYIKTRDNLTCYTCGKRGRWEGFDAGHFIPRHYNLYRYEETNIFCQCIECNRFKSGNIEIFKQRFIAEFGLAEYEAREVKKHQLKKYSIFDLEEIKQEYKRKIERL